MYDPVADLLQRTRKRRLKDRFVVSLLQSSRVRMFALTAVIIVGGIAMGLTPAVAIQLATVAAAWIVGESIRPSQSGILSRRFLTALTAQLAAILANVGLDIPAEDLTPILVLLIGIITGDSWRSIKTKDEQEATEQVAASVFSGQMGGVANTDNVV